MAMNWNQPWTRVAKTPGQICGSTPTRSGCEYNNPAPLAGGTVPGMHLRCPRFVAHTDSIHLYSGPCGGSNCN
ncbi:MAG: hypothetical protein PsegKO_22030 [Pseudohongiellaceae bacterium]